MHIKTKQNIEYIKESWYEIGAEKFKDLNWKGEISLFHLNDKELKSTLESLQNLIKTKHGSLALVFILFVLSICIPVY